MELIGSKHSITESVVSHQLHSSAPVSMTYNVCTEEASSDAHVRHYDCWYLLLSPRRPLTREILEGAMSRRLKKKYSKRRKTHTASHISLTITYGLSNVLCLFLIFFLNNNFACLQPFVACSWNFLRVDPQ